MAYTRNPSIPYISSEFEEKLSSSFCNKLRYRQKQFDSRLYLY